jgi:hypothetical protein
MELNPFVEFFFYALLGAIIGGLAVSAYLFAMSMM